MFLPMSCTSPFTVASTTLPAAAAFAFSASICGCKSATAFFMVLAVRTTCGRNILPAPKSAPTSVMPSMSGPSMMRTAGR